MTDRTKVLVVEDTQIAQKVAKIILVDLKCDVDIAENGQKALQLFQNNQYDLVLLDLGLPDIAGEDVTKSMRKSEKGTRRTPIVALTAYYDESYQSNCLAMGIDDFILKPLNKEKGKGTIEKHLKLNNSRKDA